MNKENTFLLTGNQQHGSDQINIRLAEGDESAFRQLFLNHYNHIYGFILTVIKVPVMAEELTNDVFLQVWKNRSQLRDIRSVENWLFIIARNSVFTALKRQVRENQWVKEVEEWLQGTQDADSHLLLKETSEILRNAARALPPQQSEIFRLSRLEDLSLDDIAEKLQISKHTVKYHLTKALAGVRLYLAAHQDLLTIIVAIMLWLKKN